MAVKKLLERILKYMDQYDITAWKKNRFWN